MTTDSIQDLVKRLRAIDHTSVEDCFLQSPYFHKAADALEAMAGEVAQLKSGNAILKREMTHAIEEVGRMYSVRDTLSAERDRLKAALETIAHDNVPREVFIVWRTDGSNSKHDKCQHMRMMYEDCGNCTALFARKALGDAS